MSSTRKSSKLGIFAAILTAVVVLGMWAYELSYGFKAGVLPAGTGWLSALLLGGAVLSLIWEPFKSWKERRRVTRIAHDLRDSGGGETKWHGKYGMSPVVFEPKNPDTKS